MTDPATPPVVSPATPDVPGTAAPELPVKEDWGELTRTAMIAILLALLIRTFLFEPFNIPSGSMIPNLLVGDYLFVTKYSYGYSRYSFPFGIANFEGRLMPKPPMRGDVVVFRLPTNTSIDYIKRVIGMPGETLQVKAGRLYINDKMIPREAIGTAEYDSGNGGRVRVMEYMETLPGNVKHTIYETDDDQPLDNTEKFTIPEGHYFMMGDNRDNSQDSRVMSNVGYVPFDNMVGRADFMFFSTNGSAAFYEPWKWPWTIRYGRLFHTIKGGSDLIAADEAPAQ